MSHCPTNVTLKMTVETIAMKVTVVGDIEDMMPGTLWQRGWHPCSWGWVGNGGLLKALWGLTISSCMATSMQVVRSSQPLPCRGAMGMNVNVNVSREGFCKVISSYTDVAP